MNDIPATIDIPQRYRSEWPRPKCQGWIDKFTDIIKMMADGGTACLIGGRGTGKTRMAAEVVRDRLPIPATYTTAMDIFLRIRESYAKRSEETERQIVDRMAKVPLLIIDEIQERGNTEWEGRILTHIMDRRYGAMKATIIIGNLLPEAMTANLGESVVSRITENGGIYRFNGPSHRNPRP